MFSRIALPSLAAVSSFLRPTLPSRQVVSRAIRNQRRRRSTPPARPRAKFRSSSADLSQTLAALPFAPALMRPARIPPACPGETHISRYPTGRARLGIHVPAASGTVAATPLTARDDHANSPAVATCLTISKPSLEGDIPSKCKSLDGLLATDGNRFVRLRPGDGSGVGCKPPSLRDLRAATSFDGRWLG